MTIQKDTLIHTPEGLISIGVLLDYYGDKKPFNLVSVDRDGKLVDVLATVRRSPVIKKVTHFGITASRNQQLVCHKTDPLINTSNPHGVWHTIYARDSANRVISVYNKTTLGIEPHTVDNLVIDDTEEMQQMCCLTIPTTGIYLAGELAFLLGA
jgi:hypothetical protein